MTSALLKNPNVDQWPKITRGPCQRARAASNQGINDFVWAFFRCPLDAQRQAAAGIDVAQPRKAIDDEAQAFDARQRIAPKIRFIAVHLLE